MANDPNEPIKMIRGTRFPPAFVELWRAGKWAQPEDRLIDEVIPWLQGPVGFIETMSWMATEN